MTKYSILRTSEEAAFCWMKAWCELPQEKFQEEIKQTLGAIRQLYVLGGEMGILRGLIVVNIVVMKEMVERVQVNVHIMFCYIIRGFLAPTS